MSKWNGKASVIMRHLSRNLNTLKGQVMQISGSTALMAEETANSRLLRWSMPDRLREWARRPLRLQFSEAGETAGGEEAIDHGIDKGCEFRERRQHYV